nr:5353_t:CDS:1 [Entrophospora candida]
MIIKKKLLAIANKIYTVNPESGFYEIYNTENWSSTTAAAMITLTNKIYLTTSYGNLWEISLNDDGAVRRVGDGGWNECKALIQVKYLETLENKLFSFCGKLWLIDQKVGSYIDFSDGSSDDWSGVNAATSIDDKIYCTTSNNLWCINTSRNYKPEKVGNDDNWSNCKALVNVKGMLLAFCESLWEVDLDNGEYRLFFDKGKESNDDNSKRTWFDVKSTAVIDTKVYLVSGSQLLELDTIKKEVREVSNEDWSTTRALITVDI